MQIAGLDDLTAMKRDGRSRAGRRTDDVQSPGGRRHAQRRPSASLAVSARSIAFSAARSTRATAPSSFKARSRRGRFVGVGGDQHVDVGGAPCASAASPPITTNPTPCSASAARIVSGRGSSLDRQPHPRERVPEALLRGLAPSVRKRDRVVIGVASRRPRLQHELLAHHQEKPPQHLDRRLGAAALGRDQSGSRPSRG